MKVRIEKQGKDITLHIPTGLLLNRFALGMALNAAGDDLPVSGATAARLLEEIHRIRKEYGPWQLVEVCSADGAYVSVVL